MQLQFQCEKKVSIDVVILLVKAITFVAITVLFVARTIFIATTVSTVAITDPIVA